MAPPSPPPPPDVPARWRATVPASSLPGAPAAAKGEVTPTASAPALVPAAEQARPPELGGETIWAQLADRGLAKAPADRTRYELTGLIGCGATGEVYHVEDRNLGRDLAVKVLRPDVARDPQTVAAFVHEAQLTSGLHHPNVVPVLDLGLTAQGRPYFAMARLAGRTLGDCIQQSTLAARAEPIATTPAVVAIFIAVCQAMAYAHHQGIVHQDIKPDNILIGDFGEVVVLDWGCALRLPADGPVAISGTPLYMAPEQARAEGVDARSDCYCIGASLFHTLLLRPPTWSEDSTSFLAKKRAGVIDLPSAAERAQVPPELLAITLKAMAAAPQDRYAHAGELREDLQRYQAGLAVSARRDSPLQVLLRLHRRHRLAIWTTVLVLALLTTLVTVLWGNRLARLARWGAPTVVESFGPDWRTRWEVTAGDFASRGQALVSLKPDENIAFLRAPLSGATAVEYTGVMLPEGEPCDVGLIWCRSWHVDDHQHVVYDHPILIKIGAFNATQSQLRSATGTLAFSPYAPRPNQPFHVRVELMGSHLSVVVDGTEILAYTDPFPLTGGHLGLYGYYAGKSFSQFRLYRRVDPLLTTPTAIGDALAEVGQLEAAAARYADIHQAHPGTALAQEAQYKEGLCRLLQGRTAEAYACWAGLERTPYAEDITIHRVSAQADSLGDRELAALLAQTYHDASPSLRRRLAILWSEQMEHARSLHREQRRDLLFALYDRLPLTETAADGQAADYLLDRHRFQEVLDRFPNQRWHRGDALLGLKRYAEIIAEDQQLTMQYVLACADSGRFDLLDAAQPHDYMRYLSFISRNRAQEFIERFPDHGEDSAHALYVLGRFAELRSRFPHSHFAAVAAIATRDRSAMPQLGALAGFFTGDFQALLALPHTNPGRVAAEAYLAVQDLVRGSTARVDALGQEYPLSDQNGDTWNDLHLVLAFAADCCDHGHRLDGVLAVEPHDPVLRWVDQQTRWYNIQLLRGAVTPATFLTQPNCVFAVSRCALLEAMSAERAGNAAQALAHWRAWQALPVWRQSETFNLAWLPQFVAWRVACLSAASGH